MISVIVPIYKVERYLPKCIESILAQTYRDIEVILVDDGSTDDSGKKCDSWASKDNRIHVIHQKNAGVSAARNAGIEFAHGEYIGFVDSDDVLNLQMYEILMDNASMHDCEISCCQMQTRDIDGTLGTESETESKVFSAQEIIEGFFFYFFIRGFIVSPCNKVIKKSIIDNYNIRFKKYALAEDFLFIFEILSHTEKIIYDKEVGYYYLRRENSAMTSVFSEKRFDYIGALLEIEDICKKTYSKEIVDKAHQWVFNNVLINYRALYIHKMQNEYSEKAKE